MDDIDLLAEICDDPDDGDSDYGRGYRHGWQAAASRIAQRIERTTCADQAAAPDGPQSDPKCTPEAAAEILARELYVVGHITADDRAARGGWYRLASEGARDGWRDDARRLLASLRESDLALTWLTDATPAAGSGRIDAACKRCTTPTRTGVRK